MERRRRRTAVIEGDREATNLATTLGREIRTTRRRMRLTQAELGERVGLAQSRVGEIERGTGTGTPLLVWARLGSALRRPLMAAFSRDLEPGPADAGHADAQEIVLALARSCGRTGSFELPTRPTSPVYSVDVGLRDDRSRTLILVEVWNRLDDLGRAARSTDRKMAEAAEVAVALGGGRPYRVAACWLLLDTAPNRALVARYPETFAARFPASSYEWVRALTHGTEPPESAGVAWVDPRRGRLAPMRRARRARSGR
jgi:DNA-binding XRE family transcriptional regulator